MPYFKIHRFIIVFIFLTMTLSGNLWAEIPMAFSPIWQNGNGLLPAGCGWGDIDGDGYLDLAVGNGSDSYPAANFVFLNSEDGMPSSKDWQSSDASYTGNIVIADFNNDGRPDLLAANLGASQSGFPPQKHRLYLNNNGRLNNLADWASPDGNAFSCAAGDVDGDGDLDIAFSQGTNSAVNPAWSIKMHSVIYENTGGDFDTVPMWQSDSVYQGVDITFGDIDNDGDLDLALSGRNVGLAVFYNYDGVIETTPSYHSHSIVGGRQIVFGDVDGDGFLDLATAGIAGGFSVFKNLGGTLEETPSWSCSFYGEPSCVQLADVDGDGDLDLAGGGWYSHLGIFENEGGTLADSYTWSYTGGKTTNNLQQIAFCDYDNDSLVTTTEVFTGNGMTNLYYLERRNLHAVSEVVIDGTPLALEDYCFEVVDGWISLASPVANGSTLEVTFVWSMDLDLSATLLTGTTSGQTLVYLFENQTVTDPDDVHVLLLLGQNYGANYNIDDGNPSIREQFENFGWNITVTGVLDTMRNCNTGGAYFGNTPRAVDVPFADLSLADIANYDAFVLLPCTTGHQESITNPDLLDFISAAVDSGIVVAAWCRAVRLLAYADEINGLDVVGHAAYQTEYENAGATYHGNDHPPIVQGNIITMVRSRFYRTVMCNAINEAIIRNRSLIYEPQELLDDASGDGDGVFEGGESVDFKMSVINNTRDTVYDVAVNMSINDAAITVTNGYIHLGDLPPKDTASIDLIPLSFSIPSDYISRIDSFYIEVSSNYGEKVDSIVFTQAIGQPRVLLVDDNAGSGIDEFYNSELEKSFIPWANRSIYDEGVPSLSDLQVYDLVVWYTGNYKVDPLSANEISLLEQFMDNGGKLFLTGQGIAFQLHSLGPVDFLTDYLKSQYVSSNLIALITGTEGDLSVFPGDTLVITTGGGGALNQTYPDQITPYDGSVSELVYFNSTDCAGVSYSGDYKLVYLPFGFEALSSESDRWYNRDAMLDRLLEFFAFQVPSESPEVSLVTVGPVDVSHITDHTPEISWSFSDPQSSLQERFQIQVGSDGDWLDAEMWDSGPVLSGDESTEYAGLPLLDGDDYWVRVRAQNGSLWSSWNSTVIHLNDVPVVTGLTPANGTEVSENPPVLSFTLPADLEDDPLTFQCQLFSDEELTNQVDDIGGLTGTEGEAVSWQLTALIPEEASYFWRVCSNDGFENGAWCDAVSFYMGVTYLCGDANGDFLVNIGDAVFIVNFIFNSGQEPDPLESADVNCDNGSNIGDAVYLINFIFKNGSSPCANCVK